MLAEGKLDRLDSIFAELRANTGEEHGLHLLKLEPQRGLGHAEDEVSVFYRDGLGVAGDELSGEFFPSGANFVFVEAVLGTGCAQDGGDEICC